MTKAIVVRSFDGLGMFYEMDDIKQACKLEGCNPDIFHDCMEELRLAGEIECFSCYVRLCNDLKCEPEYRDISS